MTKTKTKKVLTKNVKLFGGPMNGRTVAIPKSAERVRLGFWTYTYAGREGRQDLFAIQPKSRRAQGFILWYVGKHGKDPRVEAEYMKQRPHVVGDRKAKRREAVLARRKEQRDRHQAA